MSYVVGVDIGASTVKFGLFETGRGILGARQDYPSNACDGPQATMNVIRDAVGSLMRDNGVDRSVLAAAGVCCPAPVDTAGNCVHPTNIDGSWRGANVRQMVTETLGVPAFLMNDGDAAAYREYIVRAAKGRHSSIMAQFITGTGLGGSVILDGKLLVGPLPATELGHIPVDSSPDADPCGCGGRGCAEARSSLMGLRNLVRRRQAAGPVPPELEGEPMAVARTLRRLVQQKDVLEDVNAIWKAYFLSLGTLAKIVVNTFGTDLVVLSGGAQERDPGGDEVGHQRFLSDAIGWTREPLEDGFPHLKQVKVEWAIDDLPDSAAYGTAQYAASQIS